MSAIQIYADFFASLQSDFNEASFHSIFADNAYFKDPFQEVRGADAIIVIFRHMYATLKHPRFEIIDLIGDDKSGYLRWVFHYNDTSFEGVSHVIFGKDGKVVSHVDYWDAASNVYEKIPILGWVLHRIKTRLKASA